MSAIIKNTIRFFLIFIIGYTANSCSKDSDFIREIEGDILNETMINEDYTEDRTESSSSQNNNTDEKKKEVNYEVPTGSYYVTTSGSSSNDGLSEATAWSIEHAFQTAKAGDHVFIKAGNYGNVKLTVKYSGSPDNPIRFIGYSVQPGDVQANQGSTFEYGDVLDANKMPLLKGDRINGRGLGTAIFSFTPHIEFSNFQITHFKDGLYSAGDDNIIDNIIVTEVGDFDPTHTSNYEGRGITVNGDRSIIKNSFVLNAGAEGFRFSECTEQKHSYNKVYCDNRINNCDYYYLLMTEANNNELSNIYVERIGDLKHVGHGLVLKFQASGNTLKDCVIKNCWFEFSYSGVKNNKIINCTSIGGPEKTGNLLIANGANNNYFSECKITNNDGVSFSDWDEDFSRGDVQNAGHHNTFYKCEISNMRAGINFYWFSQNNPESPAHDNVFEECNFFNLESLFLIDRLNRDNVLKNCTITNVSNLRDSYYPTVNEHRSLDAIYQDNTLVDCGFVLE